YTKRFAAHRIHLLGETEITYLASLGAAERRASLETFFRFDLPCVVISKAQDPPPELLELARDQGIPVIRTKLKTAEFYRRLKPFLDDAFAPTTTVHASLADVFGVVLLFLGRSGIGKSECVAMSHLMRYSGEDSAKHFNERLLKRMAEQRELQQYLEEDYE